VGYSGRYHAASLLAVFIALAIGILVGIGLADDVVSTASQELEDSLRSDLDEAEQRSEDLETDLDRERDFSRLAYPALVTDRLAGSEVAVVSLGELPDEVVPQIEAAIEPAGGSVAAVAVLAEPIDGNSLDALAEGRFQQIRRSAAELRKLGVAAGRQFAGDGPLLERVRSSLFSRFSGDLRTVDRVVFVRTPVEDADGGEQVRIEALESGLITGASDTAVAVAGVEASDVDPTTLEPFMQAGVPTADHVDLVAGQLALVAILVGAEGNFGVKDGASSFLPELFEPAGSANADASATGGQGAGAP
jgi:hypothetical protein